MPEFEVQTLILRFRDLATAAGETIRQHREKIEEGDYTWWGWWSKLGETVPEAVFRQLDRKARTEVLDLYLLDTGRAQLFQARCTEIKWETSLEVFPAPEEGRHTPDYYEGRSCLAWFRLSDIQPASNPEETLRTLSYVRVDSFFGGAESRYTPFYDKQVFSIAELIPQNRTIWFVRDVRNGDPVHEVSLFDARRVEPHDFPPLIRQANSRNLLWLSDLHFSTDDHHGFPIESTAGRKSVGASLQQSLKEDLGNPGLAGCIVSGDLTWRADPEEYRQVRRLLEEMQEWARLDSYDLMICPGNHDLAFSQDPAEKGNLVDDRLTEHARGAYSQFYREIFFREPNLSLSSGRKFLLGGALPVEIVCLNSSRLEQTRGLFQGHGFLGDDQLSDAADQMGWNPGSDGPTAFRIVVVHHHLLPVTYREEPAHGRSYSVLLDSEALARWIVKHRVRLVLHGHMHQPFRVKVSHPVDLADPETKDWHTFHVVALGSTGVERGHLGTIGKNTFGLLRFEKDHLRIEVHTLDPADRSQPHWALDIPYREKRD